jgi:antitoxin CptB
VKEEDRIRQERLRWHSRRALLELDIILQRFWFEQGGCNLDTQTAQTLARLLEMEDHDLWALISGQATCDDPQIIALIDRLRCRHQVR